MATKTANTNEAEEKVLIMIPYIEGEDPDLTVGINGVITKIKKGKAVHVSKAIAQVIANSNAQVMTALENQKKFERQKIADL